MYLEEDARLKGQKILKFKKDKIEYLNFMKLCPLAILHD